MASTINTNVMSLTAQRNLSSSQSSLAVSMQRLSSGLRVNSAKDDAAGLAIAERMNTQMRGLTVASRNANDGISLGQTAEGALGKVGDMLQRMRELAVQASNATNSTDDRKALQAEVKQLTSEIDRMAKQTSFNGQKILDGSFVGAVFQVGANSGDTVTVGAMTDATAKGLSTVNYAATNIPNISAGSIVNFDTAIAAGTLSITVGTGSNSVIDLGAIPAANSGVERLGQIVAAINAKTADNGVTAFLTKNADGTFQIDMMSGHLDPTGAAEIPTLTGFTVSDTGFTPPTFSPATGSDKTGIETLTVETQKEAWVALKKIDDALDSINSVRAQLGAVQSRFETTVSNIDIQVENLAASRGRIVDADFAKETANLSRTQILQQAGTAMVAQANQSPQLVLKLLQG